MRDFGRKVKAKLNRNSAFNGRQNAEDLDVPSTPSPDSVRHESFGLFPLTDASPSSSGTATYNVDIIAVHGLNGDAFTTWTHSNGTFWVRDYLPTFLPGCRVYTYGYPSRIFTNSYASVRDYARHLLSCVRDIHESSNDDRQRSIIFVCHSLGGIVCKQALVFAHEDDGLYGETLRAVIGIVFLGTPHRGSEIADIGKVVGRIINLVVPHATRTDLLSHLGKDSQALQDLASAFRHRLQNLEIVTFHELEPTPPSSSLIVEKVSSILDVPHEDIVPLYENHRDICRFSGQTASYKAVSNALRRMSQRAQARVAAKSRINTHSSQQSFNETEKSCIALFSVFDIDDYHRQLPKPVKGTFHWILDHPLFAAWSKATESSILWLTGHPGSGKTTMSSFLAKHLQQQDSTTAEARRVVCVYFCDDKINKQKDAKGILLGVIFQIIRRHRSLIRYVRRSFELQGASLVQSLAALWKLFLDLIKDPKSEVIYVILDALDECEEKTRNELLASIAELFEDSEVVLNYGSSVKFILTSRPSLLGSGKRINYFDKYRLAIDERHRGYDEDIRIFIQERVGEIVNCPPDLREYLMEALQSRADQTFLWIHLVLAALESSLVASKESFATILSNTPASLQLTYRNFLTAIPEDHESVAARLLGLILGSIRPLTLDEINIAFSINWDHRDTKEVLSSCQIAISRTLLGILGPLVRISESRVSLIHQTAKEFLLDSGTTQRETGRFPVTAENCSLQIATACIRYLLLADFSNDVFSLNASPTALSIDSSSECGSSASDASPVTNFWLEDSQIDYGILYESPLVFSAEFCNRLSEKHGFYRYAALHWAEHYALCEEQAPLTLQQAARALLDTSSHFCSNWLRFYWTEAETTGQLKPKEIDEVELVAYFNLHELLKEILENQDIPLVKKTRALFWACRRDHGRTITTLLRAGAEPNQQILDHQTALTIAAEMGNFEGLVALLNDPRTNINSKGRRGRAAISFAAANGRVDTTRLLLTREDVLPDQVDDMNCTALIWATWGGYAQIVRQLARDIRVDVNHQDNTGRTAISHAAGEGQVEALRVLLKQPRVDVNLQDKKGLSPLLWAVRRGQTEIVRLLSKNTNVRKEITDIDDRGAISWACGQGHVEVLRMLIKLGCPGINDTDIDGWKPLAWAIQNDAPELIETLLLFGKVDLEERDFNGKTALWWAVDYGHIRNVRALLGEGANPNARSNDGMSAEDVAKGAGRFDLVQELHVCHNQQDS